MSVNLIPGIGLVENLGTDQSLLPGFGIVSATESSSGCSLGYGYYKTITIDNTKVSGSGFLADFPVLISHTDADLKTVANGGKVQNASGYDIRFETTDGIKLNHEVVFWSATTGQFIGYVRIPLLDGGTDTVIRIYYGNSGISTPEANPTEAWNAAYKGVWHMIQDPSGSSPQVLDSTNNNYDMTANGTMTSGDLITGQIYQGIDFDSATSDYLVNTAWSSGGMTGNAARTIETWFKIASTPNFNAISWGAAGANQLSSFGCFGNNIGYTGFANDNLVSGAAYEDDAWHHMAITHDGSTMKIIIDGVQQLSVNPESLNTSTAADLYFGRYVGGSYYDGALEEVRISTVGRSNDWIITSYENQKNVSTFYTLGSESSCNPASTFTPRVFFF